MYAKRSDISNVKGVYMDRKCIVNIILDKQCHGKV